MLCIWYVFNFTVTTAYEYLGQQPFLSTIFNGALLSITVCAMAFMSWRLSRRLLNNPIPVQVLGHIVAVTVWFFIIATISYLIEDNSPYSTMPENWREHVWEQFGSKSVLYNLEYATAIAAFYILSYIDTLKEKENEKTMLAIENNEMQLSLLKSQINPHFLFNTLNSISTLMNTNKTKARQMMTMLGDVLRYALDSNSILEVPLVDELNFIRNYISIQQVRFGDRLKYVEDIDKSCLSLTIPPMVLQPLVENSVKHGITPKEDGGTISLAIKRKNNHVQFKVADDGIGLANKTKFESSNSGVGFVNSDRRLQNMYGKNSKLRISADTEGFVVHFKIPDHE